MVIQANQEAANITLDVSDSEDPDETVSLFATATEACDKQQSQEAQSVTVSVSDRRGVDVTVDSYDIRKLRPKQPGRTANPRESYCGRI